MGTGPATHLGAHRNPKAVILITPFTSIRNCMIDIAGSLMRYIAKDQFKNIEKIGEVNF